MSNTPHLIEIDCETKSLTEWIEEYKDTGITRSLVLGRIARGWTEEDAIVIPPRRYRDNKRRIAAANAGTDVTSN